VQVMGGARPARAVPAVQVKGAHSLPLTTTHYHSLLLTTTHHHSLPLTTSAPLTTTHHHLLPLTTTRYYSLPLTTTGARPYAVQAMGGARPCRHGRC
jgi:hypothetical protein